MNQILIGWSFIEVKKSYSVSNDPVWVCDYCLETILAVETQKWNQSYQLRNYE